MDTANHPDPFQDAMSHGLQRAVQVASSVMTGAQVYVHLKRTQARVLGERDERARRALTAQIRADRDAARAGWAPALDPGWLRHAGLPETARAWGAAMPCADRAMPWYEPAAATAMRKCEERQRDLHPYAMARYDRLRADGMSAAEAMREAAPLFARPSRAYDAPSTPRPVLAAGDGAGPARAADGPADAPGPGVTGTGADTQAQEGRGRQILDALQARARAHGRDPLGEAEQRTVLETITNLPPAVIDHVVEPGATAGMARTRLSRASSAGATTAADAAGTRAAQAARPWEHDFPMPIHAVVASTATPTAASRPAATTAQTPRSPRRL